MLEIILSVYVPLVSTHPMFIVRIMCMEQFQRVVHYDASHLHYDASQRVLLLF